MRGLDSGRLVTLQESGRSRVQTPPEAPKLFIGFKLAVVDFKTTCQYLIVGVISFRLFVNEDVNGTLTSLVNSASFASQEGNK